jgi:hypothetical protein
MIAPAGSGSFLMVREAFDIGGETFEPGLYIANVPYGFYIHDDGNETFSFVAALPEGLTVSDVTGLATIVEPGAMTVGLSVRSLGLYRGVYDFEYFDGWYADGAHMT